METCFLCDRLYLLYAQLLGQTDEQHPRGIFSLLANNLDLAQVSRLDLGSSRLAVYALVDATLNKAVCGAKT